MVKFDTDSTNTQQFIPHGNVLLVVEDCIAQYHATGPFNEQLVEAIAQIETSALQNLRNGDNKWAELVVFNKSCLAVPAFLTKLQGYMKEVKDSNEAPSVAAFVIADDVEGAGMMNSLYQKCYQEAGIELSIFQCKDDALSWLKAQLN